MSTRSFASILITSPVILNRNSWSKQLLRQPPRFHISCKVPLCKHVPLLELNRNCCNKVALRELVASFCDWKTRNFGGKLSCNKPKNFELLSYGNRVFWHSESFVIFSLLQSRSGKKKTNNWHFLLYGSCCVVYLSNQKENPMRISKDRKIFLLLLLPLMCYKRHFEEQEG